MKKLFLLILLFCNVLAFSQSPVKNNAAHIIRTATYGDLKNVTFPSNYISGEKNGLKLFYCNDSTVSYQAMVYLTSKFPDVTSRNLTLKLDSTSIGYFSAFKFDEDSKTSRDTTINNIRGRYLYAKFLKNQGLNLASVHAFFTVYNKTLYFFQVFTKNDNYDMNSIRSFFKSIEFTGKQF